MNTSRCGTCDIFEESSAVGCPVCGGVFEASTGIRDEEFLAFIDTIPESVLPHLSEKDIEQEYHHHFGKP